MLTRRHVLAGLPLIGCATAASAAIDVRAAPGAVTGTLKFERWVFPCALGRSGIRSQKAEGDGATPAGIYPLREVRYRPDRFIVPPFTALPRVAAHPTDGWCDDPADPSYNRLVTLPYPHSAEQMWRDDHAYDLLAVIGYNDAPPVPGTGSAIFLHVMREDGGPTAGCIALRIDDLSRLIARCRTDTQIRIAIA